MKAKSLAMTAIICAASIFGTNFATAYSAPFSYELQATKIENNIEPAENAETEQLSKKVRDRNRVIGAVLGIAAIAAIANHNDKHRNDDDYNRNRRRGSSDRNTPPPPPMPSHSR